MGGAQADLFLFFSSAPQPLCSFAPLLLFTLSPVLYNKLDPLNHSNGA